MVNILNRGQETMAREILSMRALMAAESGAERALNLLFLGAGVCGGDLSNPPNSFAPLANMNPWNMVAAGMTGCEINVSCGLTVIDSNNDGIDENFYTLHSQAGCGPAADRAYRIVEVQAR